MKKHFLFLAFYDKILSNLDEWNGEKMIDTGYISKSLKILGTSIWKIFTYFILYSIVGFIIETIFGIITTGLLESRRSFLYGPFCGIYGVGAVCIILFSKYFDKNNFSLFVGGYIIGTIIEYMTSFLVETILHTQWWDYSGRILNLNGRVCLLYSLFWGILTIFLIKKFNPIFDRLIEKIKNKYAIRTIQGILTIVIIFLIVDVLATCYAQDKFITRMVIENNIAVKDYERRLKDYEETEKNEFLSSVINTLWNNKKMLKTFPNIKIEDANKNVIYIGSLLPDIQPYYIRIFPKY